MGGVLFIVLRVDMHCRGYRSGERREAKRVELGREVKKIQPTPAAICTRREDLKNSILCLRLTGLLSTRVASRLQIYYEIPSIRRNRLHSSCPCVRYAEKEWFQRFENARYRDATKNLICRPHLLNSQCTNIWYLTRCPICSDCWLSHRPSIRKMSRHAEHFR